MTVAGNLLLFRYFDFDVEPGNAYRYRVQLVLRNPSFSLPLDRLVDPTVAEGHSRVTGWSAESDPAVVGEDARYYLTRVDSVRGAAFPSATFNIFQWNQSTGTPVNNDRGKFLLGQRIGGDAKTELVSIPNKVSEETVQFDTGDYLIDALRGQPVEDGEFARFAAFHGDLKIASDGKSRPDFADKAIVVNEFGELDSIDTVSRKSAEKQQKDRQERFVEVWKKELVPSGAATLLGGADQYASEGGYETQQTARKKGKKATDNTRIPVGLPGANPGASMSDPSAGAKPNSSR